ncbi:MAG: replication-associated recombination protein A [Pseudomonadales bacterium]
MADLFSTPSYEPLAARMRPRSLSDYIGQEHILAPGKALRTALEEGMPHSMVLWGPPGVGKTTLAKMIAELSDANFEVLSAVMAGVKDIRAAVDRAKAAQAQSSRKTLLFVDEVHRFNKAQQDAFLPYVEDGTVIFIGATTENPSFELNNALLSRVRVYVLRSLDEASLVNLLQRALSEPEKGYGKRDIQIDSDMLANIARAADGDARRALNLLEIAVDLGEQQGDQTRVTDATLSEVLQESTRRFDKGGDVFYEQISALHKAVRGSSPDAALYWCMRMLDGGCDPIYIARRVLRMASEDIGNADPRALDIALSAWQSFERLGSPEGELAIAQAVVYLACAAKSNAVYQAYNTVKAEVKSSPSYEVPNHLRNAPTQLMKDMDYGMEYRYAHNEPNGYAAGENYMPEPLHDRHYYVPVERGLETKIKQKLDYLRELDKNSRQKRYK